MTPPLIDSSQLAAAGNLASLKEAASTDNPQALREAARQFESLFTSMVLKSMQQANFKDPLFGSDQEDLYQDMYDDQVAAEMSKGKGLGLADMLVQQLRREGAAGAQAPGGSAPSSKTPNPGTTAGSATIGTTAGSATIGTTAGAATAGTPGITLPAPCPTSAQQAGFARALWPDAQQAARQLGVSPVTLLAQAALETDWGRSVPESGSGGTSNNLFGIKTGSGWSGPTVASGTEEYSGGAPMLVKAQFRAYGSASHCFRDYVALLRGNPRYAAALGTGADVQAFGSALQQGGYATDPAYASKLVAVAGTLTRALAAQPSPGPARSASAATPAPAGSLKFAANPPTTYGSSPLQRR